jgi:hypothetical protein
LEKEKRKKKKAFFFFSKAKLSCAFCENKKKKKEKRKKERKMTQEQFLLLCATGVCFAFCTLITFIVCTFFVVKLWQLGPILDESNIFFYQYNKTSRDVLDKYKDYTVKKIHVIRQPFSKFITFLLNVITWNQYHRFIQESPENCPFHTSVVFELCGEKDGEKEKDGGKGTKFILVEKNNCINISETFLVHSKQEWKSAKKSKFTFTLGQVLDTTEQRIGTKKYFNWHLYKNNCQEFTNELLITMQQNTVAMRHFIFRDKVMRHVHPSDFTLHAGNCLCILYNIVEKLFYNCV